MPAVELRPAVFRGELDVLSPRLSSSAACCSPVYAVRCGIMIVPVYVVRMFQSCSALAMYGRSISPLLNAIATSVPSISGVCQPECFTGIRFRHPQPQIAVTRLSPLPVKVISPSSALPVQVSVDIVLFPALNPGRKCAVNFRTRDFRRAETVTFSVRHAPHRHVQTGITRSRKVTSVRTTFLQGHRNDIALRLQHLSGRQAGSIAEQMNAG